MTGRSRKNWLKYLGILILAGAIIAGGIMIWKSFQKKEEDQDKTTTSTVKPTESVKEKNDENTKVEKIEVKEDSKSETGKEEIKQFDGDDPNENEKLTGAMTYAGVSGDNLVIRVNIDQYLSGGECKLELVNDGGVVYSDTAEVIDSAATATCEGFNVMTTGLPSGKIGIRILVTSGEKTGTIEGEANL